MQARLRFSAHEYLRRAPARAVAAAPVDCLGVSEYDAPTPGGPPLDLTEESARGLRRAGQDAKEGAGRTDPDQPAGRDREEPPRDKS